MPSNTSTDRPALQQPPWPDPIELWEACARLATAAAPVSPESARALRDELARAATGDGFVLVGGECAELFDDASPGRVVEKAANLHRIADGITDATGVATTRIGRFAGQFAKPRSNAHEQLPDGRVVLSYRGDAVNGLSPADRRPNPRRLLTAYQRTLEAVRALRAWDDERSTPAGGLRQPARSRTYVSHEALLLDYERALVRGDGQHGDSRHAASGHYLWIGDRTRDPEHRHVAFAAEIQNPIGVKLGPSATPSQVRALTEILDPGHVPGRLSLIVRLGARHCAARLPRLVEALGPRAHDVLWVVDPMHGNGRTDEHGQKTRLLADITDEILMFFQVLTQRGLWPGGIHLELTSHDVIECVSDASELGRELLSYQSACDPRLNPEQVASVADLVGELLADASTTRRVAA